MRLVTRSDFDGLVCAMILKEAHLIDDIKFVHPKDVQDGMIDISDNDITTNLPLDTRAHLCFDHHESELTRNQGYDREKWIIDGNARSAARVVYNYYKDKYDLHRISDEIMYAVDKGDSADFTREEVLNPTGWVLLNFIMDSRTGLGRFHDFRISNYDLMMELIDYCLEHPINDILELPDVKERVDMYFAHQELYKEQINRVAHQEGRCVVVDIRNEETIYTGNRFLIYVLFPDAEYSIHVARGFQGQNTPLMIGKSIFKNETDKDIAELCLKYGGGGHRKAGTCQVANEDADRVLSEIVAYLNS